MHFTTLALTTIVSLASAAPASLETRFPTGRYINVFPSSATSIYYAENGAIDYGVKRGEVSRNDWNGRDNSTLVNFDLNGRNLPDKCSLRFWLEPNSQYNDPTHGSFVSGKGVFSSLQPAPREGSKGWDGPGSQRNNPLGRVKVNYGGDATTLDFAPD